MPSSYVPKPVYSVGNIFYHTAAGVARRVQEALSISGLETTVRGAGEALKNIAGAVQPQASIPAAVDHDYLQQPDMTNHVFYSQSRKRHQLQERKRRKTENRKRRDAAVADDKTDALGNGQGRPYSQKP